MRTLSARILLGFAALTLTFGVITATIVGYMRQVEDQVVLIFEGYVPLALESKDLKSRQDDLRKYLETGENIPKEGQVGQPLRVSNVAMGRYRRERDNALKNTRGILEALSKKVDIDPRQFVQSRPKIESLERAVAGLAPLYEKVLESKDPTEAERARDLAHNLALVFIGASDVDEWLELAQRPLVDPIRLETLIKLRNEERKLAATASNLSEQLEHNVATTRYYLQQNELTLRMRTLYFGIAAVAAGLLITLWVVFTLRPLRRLREGARRIAAGDYASRIPEKGPSEIAELAREFNSMGRGIEDRERERVRAERLAAVGKMAAMITHEVRNPLSSIGLNAELLEDELGDQAVEARNLCRAIHREVDRLTAITEEYLAFARLPKPKVAPEAVNTLVGALVAFVREDLAANNISLVVELAPGDPIARIDAGQIRQCLINLVRNAADAVTAKHKAGGSAGTVVVRTRQTARRVSIDVEDDGTGIPPDVQAKLFDPFFSTKESGNGLGLALTQQIVRDHGGDLQVVSTVGRGTTFTLSVPVGGPVGAGGVVA
ncbi:MAG: HAMP domain-containing protein [Deltaproteobacteria bacterium]|nr:HAMP domain-containing protein [Deltaproteobacteria bacterium]MCW5801044.1 HAMP domain-containing protein [Deltaproteobacteria bacterium]